MSYSDMTIDELKEEQKRVRFQHERIKGLGLNLDMSRGKPSSKQLSLSNPMLQLDLNGDDYISAQGLDCRNYGGLDGVIECKRIFSEILEVNTGNIILGGPSSLNLMYDFIAQCMTHGIGNEPWLQQGDVKFICAVPGYDRHFAIAEYFGIEMVNVNMTPTGPDMDAVEELIKDEKVKGMFCVPKYSNPTGVTYSDETVKRFAALKPAASDFRVIWDNAYCVHDFNDTPDRLYNIFEAAAEYGSEDMFIEFASTSKVSFPGGGVAALTASDLNISMIKYRLSKQTICYDKLNQIRHYKFFRNKQGVMEHMKKHAELIAPKFEMVLNILENELGSSGLAAWTNPNGGYFISFDTTACSAKRVGELCRDAGVILTTVGATFPYKIDPEDKNIRIAPTYPPVAELAKAAEVLCLCVKMASLERMLGR